jgi:hypothetical protein
MNNVRAIIRDKIPQKFNLETITSKFSTSVTSTVEDFTIIPIFGKLTFRVSVTVKTVLLDTVGGKIVGELLPKFFKA